MAESAFLFRLVTPQRLLREEPVQSLQVPGSEGYLGILANHAPLITMLKPGRLDVRDVNGAVQSYAVSGGFLEVSANRATVLADAAESAQEIDRARAEAARTRAEARLGPDAGIRRGGAGDRSGEVIDRARAERALARAKARLSVVAS